MVDRIFIRRKSIRRIHQRTSALNERKVKEKERNKDKETVRRYCTFQICLTIYRIKQLISCI
jgi:hypothetical protein